MPKTINERQKENKTAARCAWFVAKKLVPLFDKTFQELVSIHQSLEGENKEKVANLLRTLMTFQEVKKKIPKTVFERVRYPKRLKLPKFTPADFLEPTQPQNEEVTA